MVKDWLVECYTCQNSYLDSMRKFGVANPSQSRDWSSLMAWVGTNSFSILLMNTFVINQVHNRQLNNMYFACIMFLLMWHRAKERAPLLTYLVIVIGRDSLNEGCFARFVSFIVDALSILLSELSDSCQLKHEGLIHFLQLIEFILRKYISFFQFSRSSVL